MAKTTTAYRFDSQGYLCGTCLVQEDPKSGEYIVPSDSTLTEPPAIKAGYWLKWNGKKWASESKPTTCKDAIAQGLTCVANGPGLHNRDVKTLLETLVASDSENYRIVVDDKLVESIEEIPEPTEAEKELEEEQAKEAAAQAAIDDLIKQMTIADLNGDEDWKADLRAEYAALMEAGE